MAALYVPRYTPEMEIEAEMAMARYSPLSVDSYGAVSDGGVSDSAAILTINMMDQTSPPRVQTHVRPPLYSAQTRSLSDPNFLHQHQLVNASPGVPYCIDDSMIDFDAIEALALLEPHSDLGPPPMPVRLTRLDEEPPKNKVCYSPSEYNTNVKVYYQWHVDVSMTVPVL